MQRFSERWDSFYFSSQCVWQSVPDGAWVRRQVWCARSGRHHDACQGLQSSAALVHVCHRKDWQASKCKFSQHRAENKAAGKIQVQDKPLCERGEAEPLRLGVTGGGYTAEDKGERSQHVAEEKKEERRLYRFFNSHVSSANGTNRM